MRYRPLGPSGLIVSELCLGAMTFGGDGFWRVIGAQQQDEAAALVKRAFEAGVTFIDTANIYSNGLSEEMLGAALRTLGLKRDELVIATKAYGRVLPLTPPDAPAEAKAELARRASAHNISGLSRKHLFDAVDASLARLGVDHIDLYQVHGADPLTPIEETLEALNDIVRSGRVRYIELCNMAAWAVMKALGICERRGLAKFVSCQMYYSIAGRDIEREVAPMAKDQGLAILPWSPLAGGFLSGKFHPNGAGPDAGRRAVFDFPPVDKTRGFAIIDVLRDIGAAHHASPARIALAWLLHQGHVTSVIIGARTIDQLEDNLAAVTVTLTPDELERLDAASKLPEEYPGWMLERMGADRRNGVG